MMIDENHACWPWSMKILSLQELLWLESDMGISLIGCFFIFLFYFIILSYWLFGGG